MPTVLYADDEQEHRLMMEIILKNQDITFLEAANGEEAIAQIKQYRPDLILLDLFMPRIDGFGVLKIIKADPQFQHIPVIILSAWPTGDNRERARNYGAVDFVAKPYDPLRLVEIIEKQLAQQNSAHLSQSQKGDTAPLNI